MEPGDYSDALRALGRFLETVNARNVEIAFYGDEIGAAWQAASRREVRKYRLFEIAALRMTERLYRGLETEPVRSELLHDLRVVGQDLDEMGARQFTITETPEGVHVSAVVGARPITRTYDNAELSARADQMRRGRRPEPAA